MPMWKINEWSILQKYYNKYVLFCQKMLLKKLYTIIRHFSTSNTIRRRKHMNNEIIKAYLQKF